MTLTEKRLKRLADLGDLGAPPRWWQWRKMRAWRRRWAAIWAMDLSEAAEMMRSVYTPMTIERIAVQQNSMLAFLAAPVKRKP